MKWSLASVSVYKRAEAHLTRRTTHGAVGKYPFDTIRRHEAVQQAGQQVPHSAVLTSTVQGTVAATAAC